MNWWKNQSASLKLIIISLIAAIAMVLASAAFEGAAQTITFLIIAVWWVPFMVYGAKADKGE